MWAIDEVRTWTPVRLGPRPRDTVPTVPTSQPSRGDFRFTIGAARQGDINSQGRKPLETEAYRLTHMSAQPRTGDRSTGVLPPFGLCGVATVDPGMARGYGRRPFGLGSVEVAGDEARASAQPASREVRQHHRDPRLSLVFKSIRSWSRRAAVVQLVSGRGAAAALD